jgi:hypothetical protein
MKYSWKWTKSILSTSCCLLIFSFVLPPAKIYQTKEAGSRPVMVSVQMENGRLIYKVDDQRVEYSRRNSLLINLENIQDVRGSDVPVFIVIDVRAPFSEVGKIETALDKVGLTHHRLFVSTFREGIMNEIHWDETAVPIPRH